MGLLSGIKDAASSVVKSGALGSIIGAGASLAGGIYSANKSQQIANNVNLLNYKQAKEFAQNQLQWRVADAKKAGLHPLVGVGASLYQSAPTAVGGDSSGLGNGLAEMGQNISRAVDASMNYKQRQENEMKQQQLMDLQILAKKQEIAESHSRQNLNDAQANRVLNPIKDAAVGNSIRGASVFGQPRIPARPFLISHPRQLRGKQAIIGQALPDYQRFKTEDGTVYTLPSEAFENSAQNSWGIPDAIWYVNRARRIWNKGPDFSWKRMGQLLY